MGNLSSNRSIGIDSIGSVKNTVEKILYSPPKYGDNNLMEAMSELSEKKHTTLHMMHDISTLMITPESFNQIKYIVFSHGNASDIYSMYGYCKLLSITHNATVICYDYPGYGITKGRPTEDTCYDALTKVISYMTKEMKIPSTNIILMGQSLGTGVVIDYIANHPWHSAVILISPYKSIPRVLCDSSIIDSSIANYRYASIDKINKITCPVKIFHGIDDQLIKIKHGSDLYSLLPNKKLKPVWLENTGHNDILAKISYADIEEVLNHKHNIEVME